MPTKYRADQVGSFLRPQEVLDAHVAHRDGKLPLEQLRAIEDKAIIECLAMQKASGIDVYSDGEFRRAGWSSDFAESVDGYVPGAPPSCSTSRAARRPRPTASARPADRCPRAAASSARSLSRSAASPATSRPSSRSTHRARTR